VGVSGPAGLNAASYCVFEHAGQHVNGDCGRIARSTAGTETSRQEKSNPCGPLSAPFPSTPASQLKHWLRKTAKGGAADMKRRSGMILLVSFLWMSKLSALAVTIGSELRTARIRIRVWDTVQIARDTLEQAKTVTEKVYEHAGIEIAWSHCVALPTPENFACASPVGPGDIVVRVYLSAKDIASKTSHFTGGAAIPLIADGARGIVLLFYDHLERTARHGKIPLEVVLGITMAHEIGHLMISPGHAVEGIMRGRLTREDWLLASQGKLCFHPKEVETMRKRVLGLAQIIH
jgi:hypothetical protein